jgi:hypothetical protein
MGRTQPLLARVGPGHRIMPMRVIGLNRIFCDRGYNTDQLFALAEPVNAIFNDGFDVLPLAPELRSTFQEGDVVWLTLLARSHAAGAFAGHGHAPAFGPDARNWYQLHMWPEALWRYRSRYEYLVATVTGIIGEPVLRAWTADGMPLALRTADVLLQQFEAQRPPPLDSPPGSPVNFSPPRHATLANPIHRLPMQEQDRWWHMMHSVPGW